MLIQAKRTVEAEGLNIDADAVDMVVHLAGGDMRKVLNVLQVCSMAYSHIKVADVCMATAARCRAILRTWSSGCSMSPLSAASNY